MLRVRTKRDYAVPFLVDVGQRDVTFVKRPWTPLKRVIGWADAVAILPERDYDLVHAINAVPILTRRPYVLTFEDYLPRVPEDRYVGWLERWLQPQLLDPRCVGLLAISEYAQRQVRSQSRHFARRAELEAKIELLRPAVRLRRREPKRLGDGPLRLAFVAHDFMHKGGPAVVRAHERLRALGVPVQTTVVSALRWDPDGYIGPPDAAYVAHEAARLAAAPALTHHRALPNAEALAVMDGAHLLALPTFHDTFGYVALEALAGGTPVLATATCALPEVVQDGVSGVLLGLENDPVVGKWVWAYRTTEPGYMAAYDAAIERLADELVAACIGVWERRAEFPELSAGALDRARTRFGPDRVRTRLEALYAAGEAYARAAS